MEHNNNNALDGASDFKLTSSELIYPHQFISLNSDLTGNRTLIVPQNIETEIQTKDQVFPYFSFINYNKSL